MKMLNVIDDFTREALAIKVDRAVDADGSSMFWAAWPQTLGAALCAL
jgi:hypothetical protein